MRVSQAIIVLFVGAAADGLGGAQHQVEGESSEGAQQLLLSGGN